MIPDGSSVYLLKQFILVIFLFQPLIGHTLSYRETDYLSVKNWACTKIKRIEDPRSRAVYLRGKKDACSLSSFKKCSLTYKTSDLLHHAFKLCVTFENFSLDCNSEVRVDYYSSFLNPNKILIKSCQPTSNNHYCAPIGKELRVSFNSRNYCLIKGNIVLEFENAYPNTVRMDMHPCPGRSHLKEGTILAMYNSNSVRDPSTCTVSLQPAMNRARFCVQFVTYYTHGSYIDITVNDCKMRFGSDKYIKLTKICQKWSSSKPVEIQLHHEFSYNDLFYLFHYNFEWPSLNDDPSDEEYCYQEKDDDQEEEHKDNYSTYKVTLAVAGSAFFVILVCYGCVKRQSRKLHGADYETDDNESDEHLSPQTINENETSLGLQREEDIQQPTLHEPPPLPDPQEPPPLSAPSAPPAPSAPAPYDDSLPPSYESLFPERQFRVN